MAPFSATSSTRRQTDWSAQPVPGITQPRPGERGKEGTCESGAPRNWAQRTENTLVRNTFGKGE